MAAMADRKLASCYSGLVCHPSDTYCATGVADGAAAMADGRPTGGNERSLLSAIGLASYAVGVAIHMWTVSWLPGVQWRGTGGSGLGAITVGPSGAGYGQGADAWCGPYAAGVKLCG